MGRSTISDEEWAELRRRAEQANPPSNNLLGVEETAKRMANQERHRAGQQGRN